MIHSLYTTKAIHQRHRRFGRLGKYAGLLFNYCLLAEGSDLPDPVNCNRQVAKLMIQTPNDDAPLMAEHSPGQPYGKRF